jgi:hypothetical protein
MDAIRCLRGLGLSWMVLLAACGGGGSGGGSGGDGGSDGGNSLEATQAAYQSKREQAFTGKREPAVLNADTLYPFVRMVLSDEPPPEALAARSASRSQRGDASDVLPPAPDLAVIRRHVRDLMVKTSEKPASRAAREKIDETTTCSPSGEIRITGTLNGRTGTGMLQYEWRNCIDDGVTYNGVTRAWVGASGEGSIRIDNLFYDAFSVTSDGVSFQITGEIAFWLDNTVETRNVVYQFESGFQVQEENYQESNALSASGKLFLNDTGWMNVSVSASTGVGGSQYSLTGTFELSVPDQRASIEMMGQSSRVALDGQVALIGSSSLLFWDDEALVLWPSAQLGQTPVYDRLQFDGLPFTRGTPVVVALEAPTDPDGDLVTTTYRWFVNGELLPQYTGPALPAGVAVYRDQVQVVAVLSDGRNTVDTLMIETVIDDAPFALVPGALPAEVAVGQAQSFQALFSDADIPGSETVATLEYGPAGATIDAEGQVQWTPSSPLFGKTGTVLFGFRTASGEQQEIAVTVRDDSVQEPLIKTGIAPPKSTADLVALEFDGDPAREILVVADRGFLYTLEAEGAGLRQEWAYPLRFVNSNESVVSAGAVSGTSHDAIIVASTKALYRLDNADAALETLYTPSGSIQQMEMADADGDGDRDAVLLLSGVSPFFNIQRAVAVDLATGEPLYQMAFDFSVSQIRIGNVDDDAGLELVASGAATVPYDLSANGFQRRGFTFLFTSAPIRLGDVTGDGIDEIITENLTSGLMVSSFVNSTVSSQEVYSSGVIVLGNMDGDTPLEVGVMDGNFTVLDVQGGVAAPVSGPFFDAGGPTRNALVTNLDGDADPEVILFGEQNVYRLDLGVSGVSAWTQPTQTLFMPAGLGDITPGVNRAVFVAAKSERLSPDQVVLLDASGALSLAGSVAYGTVGVKLANLVDDDDDGYADLYLASDTFFDSRVRSVRIDGLVERYLQPDSGPTYGSVGDMQSLDLNADGFVDLAWSLGREVFLSSPSNQTTLSSFEHPDNSDIYDLEVADVQGNATNEIVMTNGRTVHIMKQTPSGWAVHASVSSNCQQLTVGRFDTSGQKRIVCLGDGFAPFQTLTVYSSSLVQIGTFQNLNDSVTDLFSVPGSTRDRLIRIQSDNDVCGGFGLSCSRLAEFSLTTGREVELSSPTFGRVMDRGVKVVSDVGARTRFVIGTNAAMTVTH